MTRSHKKSKFQELLRSKDGNFAMLAGLFVPVLFVAGSLAVDTSNTMSMKTTLQDAVDSAALATATRLYNEPGLSLLDAKAYATKFLQGQVEKGGTAFSDFSINPTVTITPTYKNGDTSWKVAIAVTGTQASSAMARLMGRDTMSVNVAGTSVSGTETKKGSLSMALVLDQSGSMDWKLDGDKKINTLKQAVFGLIKEFKDMDPKKDYVRLGAIGYASYPLGKELLTFNVDRVHNFTGKLKAGGGTDSTDAFGWGLASVTANTEVIEHVAKTGQTPERAIVFMTDGDNNYNSADTSTKILCDAAKKTGVTVYTVAFAAPQRGRDLLSYCATSPEHYFDAQNSAELIEAFKDIGKKTAQVVSRLTN